MIADALRERLAASPFQLKMGSGETFEVRHPELVSLSPGGSRAILWVGEDQAVNIDVLLVESIREIGHNGHRKRRSA